jgi:hypothetical protein
MTRTLIALAALVPSLALAEPPGLDMWSKNHPQASRELGTWVRNHAHAARLFFEWDGTHPERSKEFVTWAIVNRGAPIQAFISTHPGWPVFDRIAADHRPAANAFMAWCRRHPNAAEALMVHSGGLRWAGDHLYAEYWELKHPDR